MLAVASWSLEYALELGSTELAGKLFWAKLQYVSIVVLPVAWFAFALQYTQRLNWLIYPISSSAVWTCTKAMRRFF